ncbi:MAG: response regulator [Rubrivivax sp.]|nr:response regulator [Rubrivivax sp.]
MTAAAPAAAPVAGSDTADAKRQHDFVALLLRLAGRFINLPLARIGPEIQRALGDTAAFVDADRGYLFAYDLVAGTTSNTHEWCASGIEPQRDALQDLPVAMFPDWLAAHQRGEPLFVPDVAALGTDDPMRQVLEAQAIRTTVALPLLDETGCSGFVGFDFVRERRDIGAEEMGLLQLFAQMLVNVGARGRAESAVHELNASLEVRVAERTAELAAATKRAEAASQAKSELMARVSHELRTPLNAVLGFSQLLAADEALQASRSAQRHVAQVRAAGEHLLHMVDDMLDIASAEAGRLHLQTEAVDAVALAGEVLSLLEPLARRHGVTLHDGTAGATPVPAVRADRMRLQQVLVNLLSNAIKYNGPGGRAELQVHGEGGRVRLVVSDTGTGLAPDQLAALFEPFHRAGAEKGSVEGTGLGLTIARQLAQAMAGSLQAHSRPGEGSRFTLELPAWGADTAAPDGPPADPPDEGSRTGPRAEAAAPTPAATAPPRPPIDVLYVEDNAVNVLLMEAVMTRPDLAGATLHVAVDGPAGLAAAQRVRPDLILLDLSLPGMNGLELLQALRADAATAVIPCVAVSANAMPQDVQSTLDAGFADYVTKPFRIEQIAALVDRFRPPAAG